MSESSPPTRNLNNRGAHSCLTKTNRSCKSCSEAFVSISEKSVAHALASQSDDLSISAFEFFLDKWLEWLPPLRE